MLVEESPRVEAGKKVYWFIGSHLGRFSCSTDSHTVEDHRGKKRKKTTPGMVWHALIREMENIGRTRSAQMLEAT